MHQHLSQLASVFDQLAEGVVYMNPSGEVLFSNRAALSYFGSHEQWAQHTVLVDPRTKEPVSFNRLPVIRALVGETVRDLEIEVHHHGSPVRVLLADAYAMRDEQGNITGAVGMFRDITSRRDNEDLLRASEWQKAAILDHVPFATWLKDREGRYLAVNATFATNAGRNREEIVGSTDDDLWTNAQAMTFTRGDDWVLRHGESLREVQYLEQPPIIAEILKSPLYDPDGAILGTIGLARDITAEHDAKLALIQANEELESRVRERTLELERVQESLVKQERLAALGQLAGGVAHQMRNPLAAITSASYVLRRYVASVREEASEAESDAKLALEIILEEARHANDIITGLLDYTRTRPAIVRDITVSALIERALDKGRSRPRVQVDLSIPSQLMTMVDAEQVSSAFTNLIDNSYDAMPSGGVLTIHATLSDAKGHEPPMVVVTLSDTGSGITPDRRGELFKPLFTTKPLGLGLGLVTARTLIERQGGTLDYVPPGEDESSRGTTFLVHLPTPPAQPTDS